MSNLFRRFVRDEEGQDLVEYAMLLSLIAAVCVAGVTLLGGAVSGFYTALPPAIPLNP